MKQPTKITKIKPSNHLKKAKKTFLFQRTYDQQIALHRKYLLTHNTLPKLLFPYCQIVKFFCNYISKYKIALRMSNSSD